VSEHETISESAEALADTVAYGLGSTIFMTLGFELALAYNKQYLLRYSLALEVLRRAYVARVGKISTQY
jgi:hypothetical protein